MSCKQFMRFAPPPPSRKRRKKNKIGGADGRRAEGHAGGEGGGRGGHRVSREWSGWVADNDRILQVEISVFNVNNSIFLIDQILSFS